MPRSPRRRPGKDGKDGGKGQPKGQAPKTTPAPSAPSTTSLPEPPTPAPPAVPKEPTTAQSSGSGADSTLQTLLAALSQNRDDLPQNVRDMIDTHAAADHKAHAKSMHRLVALQSSARRELAATRASRQDYIKEWCGYVEGLCKLWEQHVEEKALTLSKFEEAEQQWERQLNEATQQLASLAVEAPAEGSEAIDVDAMDEQEAMVDEAARQEVKQQMVLQKMKETEQRVSEGLREACQSAAQQAAELMGDRERSPRRRSGIGATANKGKQASADIVAKSEGVGEKEEKKEKPPPP